MSRPLAIATVSLLALLLAACGAPRSGTVRYYDRNCPTCGTVESIEFVWIEDGPSGGGAVLGAIIGGVVGNQIGSGSGRRAATAAGRSPGPRSGTRQNSVRSSAAAATASSSGSTTGAMPRWCNTRIRGCA